MKENENELKKLDESLSPQAKEFVDAIDRLSRERISLVSMFTAFEEMLEMKAKDKSCLDEALNYIRTEQAIIRDSNLKARSVSNQKDQSALEKIKKCNKLIENLSDYLLDN